MDGGGVMGHKIYPPLEIEDEPEFPGVVHLVNSIGEKIAPFANPIDAKLVAAIINIVWRLSHNAEDDEIRRELACVWNSEVKNVN